MPPTSHTLPIDEEPVFTVLSVDGDPQAQDLVTRTVSTMGHKVIPVSDMKEAQDHCIRRLPDLVVLDLSISGEKGTEFCSWVKQQPGGALVPILVLTELPDRQGKAAALTYKISALDSGADDFLYKPFIFQELKARLGVLIRARGLSLKLLAQNKLLEEAQEKIVQQERQLCATQLAGAAAHTLGQPLTAMKLNCHLIETFPPSDARHAAALQAVKGNITKLAQIIEGLRKVDATKTESYHSGVKILEIKED